MTTKLRAGWTSAVLAIALLLGAGVPPSTAALAAVGVADKLVMKHDRTTVVAAPGVLGNDLNLLGGTKANLVSGVSHGDLVLRQDGGYTYTPDPGYVGSDSFRYRPSGLLSTAANVTITVTNASPVARPDAYSGAARTTLVVGAPGVLGNDTDADGDALVAELSGGGISGSLDLNPNGGFTYSPGGGFSGNATFQYRVWDGVAWSATATVTLTIAAPTPAPTPNPTPNPTPQPTPNPTPNPTLNPTPNPTPRPTPQPTPAPTATPRPTAGSSSPPAPGATATDSPHSPATPGAGSSATPGAGSSATPGGTASPSDGSTSSRSPQDSSASPEVSGAAVAGPTGSGPGDASNVDRPAGAQAPAALGGGVVLGAEPSSTSGFGSPRPPSETPVRLTLGPLGLLGGIDVWAIPGVIIGVPGLLVIIFVLLQTAGALAWIPAIRRLRGDEQGAAGQTAA